MRRPDIALLAIWAVSLLPGTVVARTITITVADRTIEEPAIVERVSILLPLRATFEALNSSVSYDPHTRVILARNILHTLVLRVGSRSALIDNRRVKLDVPPRLVNAHVYVPLRFAAQAMGAIVRYDARTGVVAVNGSSAAPRSQPSEAVNAPQTLNPPPNASVVTAYPIISASLGTATAASNAVTLLLDGNDVTPQSAFDGRNITYVPKSGLAQGVHTVAFSGRTVTGRSFATQWSFQTSAPPMAVDGVDGFFPFQFFASGAQPFGSTSNLVNFTLVGPPTGSGFVQFCSPQFIVPFSNGGFGELFRARVAVPITILNGGCPITAVFIGRFGHRFFIPITPMNNGLLTGNPINPIGQFPSTPIFVPVFPPH